MKKYVVALFAIRDMVDRRLASMAGDTGIASLIIQNLVFKARLSSQSETRGSETPSLSGLCQRGFSLLSAGADLKLAEKLESQDAQPSLMTTPTLTNDLQLSRLTTGSPSSPILPEPSSLESSEQTITITSNGPEGTITTRVASRG